MIAKGKVSVVLVSRNTLAREGLQRILAEGDFEIQSLLDSRDILLDKINTKASPDLVIIDEPDSERLETALDTLRDFFDESRFVVLADTFEFEDVVDAFKNGIDGYIIKKVGCESLIHSLHLVAGGEKVMPGQLAVQLPHHIARSSASVSNDLDLAELLSEREFETMRYLLMGLPNKVIANRLEISEATVKVRVKAILRKLHVQNRTQAAIWAVNHGFYRESPEFNSPVAFQNPVMA